MEQSLSWEATSHSASQISHPLQNLKVHSNLPLVPILCQVNPIYFLTLHFFNIHFSIIPSCERITSSWSLLECHSKSCLEKLKNHESFKCQLLPKVRWSMPYSTDGTSTTQNLVTSSVQSHFDRLCYITFLHIAFTFFTLSFLYINCQGTIRIKTRTAQSKNRYHYLLMHVWFISQYSKWKICIYYLTFRW
jgi:hypothetical protein